MYTTIDEVMEFLEENDVRFIQLAFCDIYGKVKNVSIMSTDLARAFETGISIDGSAIGGFGMMDESDLYLRPVIATMTLLPWRPAQGRTVRFYCELTYADGRHFEMDSRIILSRSIARARSMGIRVSFGAECEFYLFKLDEFGYPTNIPADHATYMDVAPYDRGENVRREICLALEQMNFAPETSHHEEGPGQNEIDFRYSDAMSSADNVVTFRSVVEIIAAANGFHASFRPKPIPGAAGNGLHINMSPRRLGVSAPDPDLKRYFMAGILRRVKEITAFLNSTEESYQRLGEFKAPKYVTWSHKNRNQLIRIPAGEGQYDRIELRSADCMANPYVSYALLLEAGLDGIAERLEPPEAVVRNLTNQKKEDLEGIEALPGSLKSAIKLAEESEFVGRIMPREAISALKLRLN